MVTMESYTDRSPRAEDLAGLVQVHLHGTEFKQVAAKLLKNIAPSSCFSFCVTVVLFFFFTSLPST